MAQAGEAEQNRGTGQTPTQAVRLLIVDDHELVRRGIRTILTAQPDIRVVGEAASGEEALQVVAGLAPDLTPDVALMDLLMPGMNGVEAARRLRDVSPQTQVVVLTSYHEDEHIFPAIRAGALSYLLKDVSAQELADAVRQAARGEAVMAPRVAARLMRELRQELRGEGQGGGADPGGAGGRGAPLLSEREMEVLRLIAEGASNTEIADRLVVTEHTVKKHVSNILGKLHLADRTQVAVYAWREGMMNS